MGHPGIQHITWDCSWWDFHGWREVIPSSSLGRGSSFRIPYASTGNGLRYNIVQLFMFPHYKLRSTSSLKRGDPSAQRGGFLALLLQPIHHLVWIPFRGYKYIHAKILQMWSRIWTWGSFCLLVYCNPVQ